MADLLNRIDQILDTLINGFNELFNADLNGLEYLSLFILPSAFLTIIVKSIKHRR